MLHFDGGILARDKGLSSVFGEACCNIRNRSPGRGL